MRRMNRRGAGIASELSFILFYVGFFGFIAFFGIVSSTVIGTSKSIGVPAITGVNVVDYFLYFVDLGGLSIVGLDPVYAALIGIPLTVGFVYVVARLVRGGG